MAKSKKPGANSSSYNKKKITSDSSGKPAKKSDPKLNEIKVKNISKKIKEINNNFECLIDECKSALSKLKKTSLSTAN